MIRVFVIDMLRSILVWTTDNFSPQYTRYRRRITCSRVPGYFWWYRVTAHRTHSIWDFPDVCSTQDCERKAFARTCRCNPQEEFVSRVLWQEAGRGCPYCLLCGKFCCSTISFDLVQDKLYAQRNSLIDGWHQSYCIISFNSSVTRRRGTWPRRPLVVVTRHMGGWWLVPRFVFFPKWLYTPRKFVTANCSTEGGDRKSAVLGRVQIIPGISVSSTPIPLKPR